MKLLKNSIIHPSYQFSIEGHPNNTSREQLDALYKLGFRRISYGVQDLDEQVQQVINRVQPFQNVLAATHNARVAGFTSINFDLIYGLPQQQLKGLQQTIEKVLTLRPDRIAFYSYAHVPWTSRGQRLFDESDLPTPDKKLEMYIKGKEMLTAAGYTDIGMDHFSLPHDALYKAKKKGILHRNFMGYTTHHTGLLLGLGVSSISDAGIAYAQNDKKLQRYYEKISNGQFAVQRGHFLNKEDLAFRQYIVNIICKGHTLFHPADLQLLQDFSFPPLVEMLADGLVECNTNYLQLTNTGQHFVRTECSAFDLHLQRNRKPPLSARF